MDHKRILLRTVLYAIITWVLLYFIGTSLRFFIVYCFPGGQCPTPFEVYIGYSRVLIPVILILSLGVNYGIALLKEKKQQ